MRVRRVVLRSTKAVSISSNEGQLVSFLPTQKDNIRFRPQPFVLRSFVNSHITYVDTDILKFGNCFLDNYSS